MSRNKTMVAVVLEVVPGFAQLFGLGHIYQGRLKAGMGLMVSYWVLQAINAMLVSVWIGLVTVPLTWLAFMVFAPTNVLGERSER